MTLGDRLKKALCVMLALLVLTLAAPGRSLAAEGDTGTGSGDASEDVTGISGEMLTELEEQLQQLGGKVADMSDEELEQQVRSFLDRANLDLSDKQIEKVTQVLKSAGEGAENISDKAGTISKTAEKLQKVMDAVVWFFGMIWDFLKTVAGYIWGFAQKYI